MRRQARSECSEKTSLVTEITQKRINASGIFRKLEPKLVEEIARRGTHQEAIAACGNSFCKNLHLHAAPFIPSPRGRHVLRTALKDWSYLVHEPYYGLEQVSRRQLIAVARIQLRNFDEVAHERRIAARLHGPKALEAKRDLKNLAEARKFFSNLIAYAKNPGADSEGLDALRNDYLPMRESIIEHLTVCRLFHHQIPEEVSNAVETELSRYLKNLPENMMAGETLGKMQRAGGKK